MRDRSNDGCAGLLTIIVLILLYWVALKIVNVFDPRFFANSGWCCTGAFLLLSFMFLAGDETQQDPEAALRYVFTLLVVVVGTWMLAAAAKSLLGQMQTWLGTHPNVSLTLLGIACLGPVVLLTLLTLVMGPSDSRNSRPRYDPNDYYDN